MSFRSILTTYNNHVLYHSMHLCAYTLPSVCIYMRIVHVMITFYRAAARPESIMLA